MRKRVVLLIFILLFSSFFVLNFVNALDSYNYFFEDPVVPHQEKLEVKNNLLVDSFTGAAVYSHPINVPPGTNGLRPNINLLYNSHSTQQNPGILGAGWSISENYIQRDTNHTFAITSDDTFVLILEGTSYDLVYSTNDGRYHTKTETFLFVNKTSGGSNQNGDYWTLKTKDGMSYRFGFYNFSELLSNKYNYTWRWSLDLVNDTHGNSIFYNYTENPFPQDNGVAYLNSIQYNNDKKRNINFYYGTSNIGHLRTVYEDGNLITQSRNLNQIEINVSNQTVRTYVFGYNRLGTDNINLSSVSNLTEYGNDSTSFLPSTTFEYESAGVLSNRINWTHMGCKSGNNTGCFAGVNGEDYGTRLIDFNGDGLVDLVRSTDNAGPFTHAWINNGSGWESTNWAHAGCTGGTNVGCFTWGAVDNGARLVDLNGDGLVDIIRALDGGSVQNTGTWIWINNGTGWNPYTPDWFSHSGCNGGSTLGCFIYYTGMDLGARFVDLNGDGLIDLSKAKDENVGVTIGTWLNNGSAWVPTNWTHPGCKASDKTGCFVGVSGEDRGVRLVDLNGDGLVDVIRATDNAGPFTYAWINNGSGWESTNWTHPGCSSNNNGCFSWGSQDNGARLVDLNGDGLVDIIRAFYGAGIYNTGTWTWMNNGTGWEVGDWLWTGCNGNDQSGCFVVYNGDDRGVRLLDLNGDGLVDVFKGQDHASGPQLGTWDNDGKTNYLLKTIDFSLGGGLEIKYQKSTYLDNTGNDSRSDLDFNLWLVSNITKNNNIEGAHNITSITFYNFTGGVYDYETREFRGFNLADEKIADKMTRHWFHQDSIRSGREFQTEILDNQSNYYKTIQKIWVSTQQNGYNVITLGQESELDYDGVSNDPKIKNVTYAYDVFGNIIYKHISGDVSNSNDDKFEYYKYVDNTNAWIVDKVVNYTLLDSNNATLLRSSLSYYDNGVFGASPTKGDITKKEALLSGGSNPTSIYEYNSFGNLVNFTDSNGKLTRYGYGVRDNTNTFPDNITNAKSQVTNYFYDLGTGNLLSERDSNGLPKNYTHDTLAIEKTTLLPFDSSILPTQEYSYDFTTVNEGKITVKQREQNGTSNTLDTYKFYDGFGKLIQTKTEASNSKQIVVDTYYDELGRIKSRSNPYFVDANENYSIPNSTVSKTIFVYDVIDRIIKITNPDSSLKNISYNHWNVSTLDENNNRKDFVLDAHSRIIQVIEFNESERYYTKYNYNGADSLVEITDALNNTFNYTYDSLGRKIKEKDPDRGTWNYTYDSEGNLIKQFDNRNISMTYAYDSLNRKLNESSSGLVVNYTYDSALNGTLSKVTINNTLINYSYDSRLRKVSEEKNISGKKYSEIWTYDSADRVTSQVMPDGRIINLTYDGQGLISDISYVGSINYNANNNPLNITYSNNLITYYDYNSSNLRLLQINTSDKQKLKYQYDAVGNVLNIYDIVHGVNFTMTYDSLNRLDSALITGVYSYSFGFIYDAIGNIRNVTGTSPVDYYYQDSRPHATSKVVFY